MANWILQTVLSIPGMVLYFSFRGFFQAWVAKKLGDTLPERSGYLTMNPIAHINPIGFLMILIVGFGFGKAIQFDSSRYKHPKRDGAIQILSAPAAGLILALALYALYFIIYQVIGGLTGLAANKIFYYVGLVLYYSCYISVALTVFHLLPLPGLDTYRLIVHFLPYNVYRKIYVVEKYSLFIFIGFLIILRIPGFGDTVRYYLLELPTAFFMRLISAPFDLIGNWIF